jgi:hypothetical protein
MVAEQSFLIDATFLLDDAERARVGSAPLVRRCGRNTSVVYGTVRDLLRLRVTLGVARGVVVVGADADADDVSSALNVGLLRGFLLGIGTNVLREPTVGVGALCRSILLDQQPGAELRRCRPSWYARVEDGSCKRRGLRGA